MARINLTADDIIGFCNVLRAVHEEQEGRYDPRLDVLERNARKVKESPLVGSYIWDEIAGAPPLGDQRIRIVKELQE